MSTITSQSTGAQSASSAWSAESSATALTPEERLLALVVYSQLNQMDAAKTTVSLSFDELARLRQEVKEAVDRAREAQHHSGLLGAISSFLGGDVAAVAGAIAAVAAVVATGGAAAAVLAVIASAASIAAQHAKELGIPPGVAVAIGIVAAGAALCSGNASGLLHVSDAVKSVACDVKLVAGIAAGAANCGAGATSIGKGAYDKDAQNALADARFSSGQQDVTNFDIDDAIKSLSASLDQQHAVFDAYTQGSKSDQASCSLVLNNFSGAA